MTLALLRASGFDQKKLFSHWSILFWRQTTIRYKRRQSCSIVGSLSNYNGDHNENGKKAMGLDWQNNKFARASRFFVHFLAVVARLQRESASFHVLSRT